MVERLKQVPVILTPLYTIYSSCNSFHLCLKDKTQKIELILTKKPESIIISVLQIITKN